MSDTTYLTIPLAQIAVPENRARTYSEENAQALAGIIAAQGLQHPITVREAGDGYELVAGLHRLRAFEMNGEAAIPARVSAAETDDEARLEEVMENLGRGELIALDRCHHLYELKQVYERVHPEAKHGGDRKSEKIKRQSLPLDPDAPAEVFGFAKAVAEKVGLSDRSIRLAVRIWTGLTPDSRARLAGTDLADKQTELKALSELTAARQAAVLALILEGRAGNVAQALELMADGVAPSVEEKRFGQLSERFKALPDPDFDRLIAAHEERVIASLKRQGRF
ncbi:ParB/RepB/Spo0J family partition protein [Rhodovulum steppense]|uniref:ParB family chromosome partitioning protein n=1 Tax=Rhodovulum steppense TaxID=540251 RepID=A0A4R1YUN8_9RHOB|nr:ParB N-terminal domain-containing protein [Rhodovulum steppense]TCM84815.1 ParB family chromosome partitioning protein [Rhodovulum steppense]